MKKIDVIVKDRNTLVLESDASKGDYIDLSSLSNVDFTMIEALIESGNDKVYNNKIKEIKETLALEKQKSLLEQKEVLDKKILSLNNELANLKKENEDALRVKELELNKQYQKEILELKGQLESLKKENEEALRVKDLELNKQHQKEISEVKEQYKEEISKLNMKLSNYDMEKKNEIDKLNSSYELKLNQFSFNAQKEKNDLSLQLEKVKYENSLSLEKNKNEYDKRISELEKKYQNELNEKDNTILSLQRQKASLNVKQTGEDLEAWCDNEMISYMQNGLLNCTWSKDNLVIKEEGEIRGSKADYIFKIYADNSHKEEELLASVCLDMKDENPDSVNKKKNSDYYKDLDKNRNKKNCKYAILVSNLELDKPNDLPIFKVLEYSDMYVVRPAYMITLLNLLASLSKRFADLILADSNEKLELKNSRELMEEFDKLKNTYLDKPLEKLGKDIEDIKKNNDSILKASKKIDELCDSITRSYVGQIKDKLDKFEIKMNREYKSYIRKEDKKIVVSE